jgi:hypothetical protein
MRSLYHHRSQIPVFCFADFLLRLALPGVPPARFQSQKTTYLATLQKPVGIFYRQDIRQRDLRSYTLDLLEQGHFLRGPDFNVACSLACSFKQTEGVGHEEDSRSTVSGRPEFLVKGQFPIMRADTDGQPRVFNCLGYKF